MIDLPSLSDNDLTEHLKRAVANERECSAEVIRTLIEVDRRKLHEKRAHPSLFAYCTKTLGYSEDAAAKRIHAAQAAKEYPSILNMLSRGRLSITAVGLLAPHLTSENHRSLLNRARGKSRRELEMMIAHLAPKPDVRETVRYLPGAPAMPSSPGPSMPLAQDLLDTQEPSVGGTSLFSRPEIKERIEPLAPQRVRFAFAGTEEFLAKVERCRQLLRHQYPHGRLEDLFMEAVEALLNRKDPDRKPRAAFARPPVAPGRRIPQWVKDKVWKRDGGRCSFIATDGVRCSSRDFIEFDHVIPWALGGPSHDSKNVRLLCRAHNQHCARGYFGDFRRDAANGQERSIGP